MKTREIFAKSILSPSKVYDWVINPYVGCQHACTYCYARFMKRFTGHKEPWGKFVDIKINAADLLEKEIRKKKRGSVWVSGVCDPYQPLEADYRLTRKCLEILVREGWPVFVQTRSSLVLRDLDIFRQSKTIDVGFSITTASDEVRRIFEPHAPPIEDRLKAVASLHREGIRTYVMMAPILPEAQNLARLLAGTVDYVIVDRMNYHHADRIYKRHGWENKNSAEYFERVEADIAADCTRLGIECTVVG